MLNKQSRSESRSEPRRERTSGRPRFPMGEEDRRPGKRGPGQRKSSPLKGARSVDFKDVELLKYFITERGRIIPRRITGLSAQQQRQLARAVKRARLLGLLPYLHQVR